MEPCLVIIGLNFSTAPVEVRERFWISQERRRQALQQLARMDGVDEVMVLATCSRTEFILWASDFSTAASSVLAFLTREYGLRLCEWKHFYRLLCDDAVRHLFRVAAGLDSMVVGPQVAVQLQEAWTEAQQARAAGCMLGAILEKGLAVSRGVHGETALAASAMPVPSAAVELAKEMLGSLAGRKVLILGAGKMGELSARHFAGGGAGCVTVADRTYEHARQLAEKLGCEAIPLEDRCPTLLEADLVVTCTSCPRFIIGQEEAERIAAQRAGRSLFFIDLAVPRNVDPAVRKIPGVFLYNLDDLERMAARARDQHRALASAAEVQVAAEAQNFRRQLASERVVPTIAALRECLDEVRRQELERYTRDFGPLTPAQEQAIEALSHRIIQRIASSLARELKELPETPEQDKMTSAVQRLFHLERTRATLAGH